MNKLQRIHLLSKPDNLQSLRQHVRHLAIAQGCSEDNIDCFVMAINEACMNVMQHAYEGAEDEEIVVEFWRRGEELLIRIIDYAEYVDPALIRSRDLEDIRPGGLGVHLMNKVMDEVKYTHLEQLRGNVLEMRKFLNKPVGDEGCKINRQDV